jgi:site-specific recombinase XerC
MTVRLGRATQVYVAWRSKRQEITRGTARTFQECLGLFAAHVGPDTPPDEGHRRDVESWLESMDVKAATLQLRLSTVKGFFLWALVEEFITRTPAAGVRAPKRPRRVPRNLPTAAVAKVVTDAADEREPARGTSAAPTTATVNQAFAW